MIYNPLGMAVVFIGYLSSLVQITATQFIGIFMAGLILAGILAADAEQRRSFKHGALLVTGGFLVSLSPILLTVPSYPTMGDQYFALLVVVGCWLRTGTRHRAMRPAGPATTSVGQRAACSVARRAGPGVWVP